MAAAKEFAIVKEALAKEIESLLFQTEISQVAFHFLQILETWNATEEIRCLAEKISLSFSDAKSTHDNALFCLLQSDGRCPRFRQAINESLGKQGNLSISQLNLQAFQNCLDTLLYLSPSSTAIKDSWLSQIRQELFHNFPFDDSHLSKSNCLISMWMAAEKDLSKRQIFGEQLLRHAELLWKNEGGEQKGLSLMQTTLSLFEDADSHRFIEKIESFLTALFYEAQSANMVKRLLLIHNALCSLNLGSKNLATSCSLANHLADAEYLFHSHDFSSAQANAEWILKFEPENEKALKIFALSSYWLGDYQKAIQAFEKIPNPDDRCKKAFVISVLQDRLSKDESHLARGT